MIEQALYEHLIEQTDLEPYLAKYGGALAVFSQEAPADNDGKWGDGPQYGRIVFAVDLQGDPERIMGGTLAVDILCKENEQYPEDIEPVVRALIHGYFFSSGTFTVSAQWKNSSYFTQPNDKVTGCTIAFELLGYPVLTTAEPDVIKRLNEWSSNIPGAHIINHDEMPTAAWKPTPGEAAIYWRLVREAPAGFIPDTFQTIWKLATIRGHVFAADINDATKTARTITTNLYRDKWLRAPGEAPIRVNRRNTVDVGEDPLRTGQITVEATYGIIVHYEPEETLNHINYMEKKEIADGN